MVAVCSSVVLREQGCRFAHVARRWACTRQCAHRSVARFDAEAAAGCSTGRSATASPADQDAGRSRGRGGAQRGRASSRSRTGSVPAADPSPDREPVLRRHDVPRLAVCDPMTGDVIRASKTAAVRAERPVPVSWSTSTSSRRIPDGRLASPAARSVPPPRRRARIGFDYVHSMVDNHSRYAYSEILPDETAPAAPRSRTTVEAFTAAGSTHRTVMSNDHSSCTRSNALAGHLKRLRARHVLIRARCPSQNRKVERFRRTLQTESAYRQVFTTNAERTAALAPWLDNYNTRRRRSSLGGFPTTACHQPDGRVQLDPCPATGSRRRGAVIVEAGRREVSEARGSGRRRPPSPRSRAPRPAAHTAGRHSILGHDGQGQGAEIQGSTRAAAEPVRSRGVSGGWSARKVPRSANEIAGAPPLRWTVRNRRPRCG